MTQKSFTTTCFFCDAESTCTDTDAGNRKFFQCTNPQCGDYEISLRAMRRMEDAPTHKRQAMEHAQMYRGTDKFVEFVVGPDNQVVGQPVMRKQ